jgi:heme/copper-type cytochrome/quinol oxidase subunit 2
VFAGSAIQTNSISIETIILSGISAGITYFLITTSRKYKALKRDGAETHKIKNKEIILKTITLVVITTTVLFFILQI